MKLHYVCSLLIGASVCLPAAAQPTTDSANPPHQRRSELRSSVRQQLTAVATTPAAKTDNAHRLSAQERSQLRLQLARGPRGQADNGRP
jgi:hypothetical protein